MADFAKFHKKQNGEEVAVNADDVSSVSEILTKEGGTKISMKNGDTHHVREKYEDVKKVLGVN